MQDKQRQHGNIDWKAGDISKCSARIVDIAVSIRGMIMVPSPFHSVVLNLAVYA
jgi:hypothetical protein